MATKPTVRIPRWGTSYTPQPDGSDPIVNPVIEPSAGMIASGWTPPPSSPAYQIANALHHDAGEWINFFAALFNNGGAFTGGAANGRLEASTDTVGEIRFKAVHNAAATAAIEATRLVASARLDLGTSGQLTAPNTGTTPNGWTTWTAAGLDGRTVARFDGVHVSSKPLAAMPSAALYLQNQVMGVAELVMGGVSGAWTMALANASGADFALNLSGLAWNAGTGELTLTHTNGGTGLRSPFDTLGIIVGGESYSASYVYKIAKNAAAGGASSSYGFYILFQPIAGGAWDVLKPGTGAGGASGLRFGIALL